MTNAEMLAHKLALTGQDEAAGRLTAAQAEGQRAILRIALGADEPCPCRDCRPAPVIPLAPAHVECCGQRRRAPWCPR